MKSVDIDTAIAELDKALEENSIKAAPTCFIDVDALPVSEPVTFEPVTSVAFTIEIISDPIKVMAYDENGNRIPNHRFLITGQ